jgi:hypothetical protein
MALPTTPVHGRSDPMLIRTTSEYSSLVYPLPNFSSLCRYWVMTTLAEDWFNKALLGEKRLSLRLTKLVTQFAERVTTNIPGSCGGAETKAAYRFLDQANADRRELD